MLCKALNKLRSKNDREKKFNRRWLLTCLLSFALATYVYWEPYVSSSSFLDRGYTATNVLVSMATSGLVLFLYRKPRIRQLRLKFWCCFAIFLCFIVNAILSMIATNIFWDYIMILVTGVGTGSVAMLFSVYNTEMDQQEIKENQPMQ